MTGYIIAGLAAKRPSWYGIFNLPHIYGVISRDGRPAPIPRDALQRIFGINQSAVPHMPGAKSLNPGDTIRVMSGGFQGHEAKLLDIKGADCEFTLSLFGKSHIVRQPIANIEAA